jgi:TetR/AcrR family transcriptional regulator, regulator of cefoperazone and chloramphenicol sensitivity
MTSQETSKKVPADARSRLLQAAEEVFAEKGYDAASVREICSKANANVAAINYYFGDKERLYLEVLKNAHECSLDTVEAPSWPAEVPPVQRLRDFIRMMTSRLHAPVRPSAIKVVMREMVEPSAAGREVVRTYIQPKAFALRTILREIFPVLDDERLLMIGFSVMGQILFYRQNRRMAGLLFGEEAVASLGLEAVTDHITRFTLAALGKAEPIGRGDTP